MMTHTDTARNKSDHVRHYTVLTMTVCSQRKYPVLEMALCYLAWTTCQRVLFGSTHYSQLLISLKASFQDNHEHQLL